jgi:hypothetical protein
MTSASRGMMMAAGCSRSRGDTRLMVRTREGEATPSATEADTLPTSDPWDLLFTPSLVRTRLRRELSLISLCGDAAGRSREETFVAVVRSPMQKRGGHFAESFSVLARSGTFNHLTMRWSERRAAVRSTLEMATTLFLRAARHPARRRSSYSR